jgi:pimeloyl-ACP methyl ester carboxylesterase
MATHWRVMGRGAQQGLALHCSLAHSGAWRGVAAGLPGLTITAPDLLGHGRSSAWDGRSDFHSAATRQAMALRAQIGSESLHLIGHSSGATIALRMALEDPDGIASLTLIEPVLFAAARAADSATFAADEAQHSAYAEALRANDRATAAAEFQKIWGAGQAFETLSDAEQTYITDRIGLIAAQQTTLREDAAGLLTYGRLESLGIPTLLINGENGPPVIDAIHTELARRLPQVTRATVPRAGHMAPITHAPACAGLIGDFLASLGAD